MCRICSVKVILATFSVYTALADAGYAQKQRGDASIDLLRIATPVNWQIYGPGATCATGGVVQFSDTQKDIASMVVIVQVYRSGKNDFVIENTAFAEWEKPVGGTNRYPFRGEVVLPSQTGTYLLKIDCINKKGGKSPKNLVASGLVFIEVKGKDMRISEANGLRYEQSFLIPDARQSCGRLLRPRFGWFRRGP